MIIGAHGAAFANVAFCKKNTKILEIKPKKHPNFFQHIFKNKELNFNLIEAEHFQDEKKRGDIFFNPKGFKKFLWFYITLINMLNNERLIKQYVITNYDVN